MDPRFFSAQHAYFPRSTIGLRPVASSYPDRTNEPH